MVFRQKKASHPKNATDCQQKLRRNHMCRSRGRQLSRFQTLRMQRGKFSSLVYQDQRRQQLSRYSKAAQKQRNAQEKAQGRRTDRRREERKSPYFTRAHFDLKILTQKSKCSKSLPTSTETAVNSLVYACRLYAPLLILKLWVNYRGGLI